MRRGIPPAWWMVAIILLGLALRFYRLGAQSLWLDEAFSLWAASFPLDLSLQILVGDAVHPPLFYLLLRLTMLAGQDEFFLRLPAAFFGVAAIPLIYVVGRRFFGVGAGLLAALLLSLSPLHVWYSQEARMYTMSAFLALLCMYFFLRVAGGLSRAGFPSPYFSLQWRENPHPSPTPQAVEGGGIDWFALGLCSALAYITHYFTLFLPLAQLVFIICTFRQNHRLFRKWVLCQALAFAPLVPWLWAVYHREALSFGIGWIPRPTLLDIPLTLWNFSLGYTGQAGLFSWGLSPRLIGLAFFALTFLNGVRQALFGKVSLLAVFWLALPLAIDFIISLRLPLYVDRHFLIALPAYLILVAGGAMGNMENGGWRMGNGWRAWRFTLGLALVLSATLSLPAVYHDPAFAKEDWRAAARYIEREEKAGDALALRQYQLTLPFDHYYRGSLERDVITTNRVTKPPAEIASGHERLWLVYRLPRPAVHLQVEYGGDAVQVEELEEEPEVLAWLEAHKEGLRAEKLFHGVYILLYDLKPQI
ncbi:MAG: glycosyltransferase family 39 protein [Anaerolineae bacterium]